MSAAPVTPEWRPTPWHVLFTRGILFAAAALVLWIAAQQAGPSAAQMGSAPDVTTYAVTHVCGTQACAPTR